MLSSRNATMPETTLQDLISRTYTGDALDLDRELRVRQEERASASVKIDTPEQSTDKAVEAQ